MLLAGKHDAVWKKFGVTGAPTLIFVDPTGKKVGTGDRGSATLIKQIGETLEKFTRAPKWADSVEAAADEAKKDQKPLLVVYRDAKPAPDAALEAFGAQPLAELYGKAAWVQKTLDIKSDEAKALGISAVPALWIIDPRVDDAKTRVLKKIGLPKGGAAISKELASVLKAWKKSSTEAPAEEPKKE